ncbi:MAG: ABC transporter ATP-binding protein [bacterium]|nr:ABC transporter ATP-binding protein [bacterium]
MNLLRIEQLGKSFGGVTAVEDLSFAIGPGTVYSIIGPNGAGKTTLFNLISGLFAPTTGSIHLDEEDISGLPPHKLAARGLSRSFQNLQIFFNMTALENVMVGHHLHSDTRFFPSLFALPAIGRADKRSAEFAAEMMDYVGLGNYIHTDSDAMPYGALKRLEIARALASRPRLLLLDEPAAGLNPSETNTIADLIQHIAQDNITVLLVEHDMHVVWDVSDHILVLDHGRRLAAGTAEEIRSNDAVVEAYLGRRAKDR